MGKLALIKLAFVFVCGVLLAVYHVSFRKRRVGENTQAPEAEGRRMTLLQSLALLAGSALLATLIVGPFDAETLRSSVPDSANTLLRHTAVINLLGFAGLTVLFFLLLGALVSVRRNPDNPLGKLLHKVNGRQKPVSFGKAESQAIKGIAVIFLVMYHIFVSGRADGYQISLFPFSVDQFERFITIFKLCVSLFALVSGYGLFLSYQKKQLSDTRWVGVRYVKTFSGFWFVFVLSLLILQALKGRFVSEYDTSNVWTCALSVVIDFLGLANLFGTPTFVGTWWYMSAAFIFILITPLVCRKQGAHLLLWLLGSIVFIRVIFGGDASKFWLGGTTVYPFLAAFLLGALLARGDLLLRIVNAPGRPVRFVVECVLLFAAYRLYQFAPLKYYWELKWALIPALGLAFCVEYVIRIPGIRQALQFLGRHSLNIYLTHNFFRAYLKSFVYGQKHFLLALLVLLLISLLCSIVIEALKKLIRYQVCVDRLCGWIERGPENKAIPSE